MTNRNSNTWQILPQPVGTSRAVTVLTGRGGGCPGGWCKAGYWRGLQGPGGPWRIRGLRQLWPIRGLRGLFLQPGHPPPPPKKMIRVTSGGCSRGAGAWGRSGGVGTGTGPGGAGTWGSSGGASTGTGPGGVGTGTGPGGAGTWGHSGGAGTGTGAGGVGTGMVPGGVGTGGADTWGHLWGAGTGGCPLQHIPSYATSNPRGTWAAAGGLDFAEWAADVGGHEWAGDSGMHEWATDSRVLAVAADGSGHEWPNG